MNDFFLIANKKAKNSAAMRDYKAAFDKHAISYQLIECEPQDLEKNIRQVLDKCSHLLIGGGDGTVRSAAQLCADKQVKLGVLPLGTLNHLVNEMKLPANPEELVKALQGDHTITVDRATVNGETFLNNSSIGLYPRFVKRRDYYKQFINKCLSYIPGLASSFNRQELFDITVKNKAFQYKVSTKFCMVSNNLYSYNFPMELKRESFKDARLGFYLHKNEKF